MGLGLENFRVFKKMTYFGFAPITILTGTNNSGKSSLIKAFQLIRDNYDKNLPIQQLLFTGESHKLISFSNVINKFSKDKNITIKLSASTKLFNGSLKMVFAPNPLTSEKSGILKSFSFEAEDTVLIECHFINDVKSFDIELPEWADPQRDLVILLKFNLTFVFEYIYNYFEKQRKWMASKEFKKKMKKLKNGPLLGHPLIHGENSIFDHYHIPSPSYLGAFQDKIIKNSKQSLFKYNYVTKGKYGRYISLKSKKLTKNQCDMVRRMEREYIYSHLDGVAKMYVLPGDKKEGRNNIIENIFEIVSRNITNHISERLKSLGIGNVFSISCEKSEFGDFILNSLNILPSAIDFFRETSLITCDRSTEALFQQMISTFISLEFEDESSPIKFINKWIKTFSLGDSLYIEKNNEGIATSLFLVKQKKKFPLNNMGNGVSQLLPILLQIAIGAKKSEYGNSEHPYYLFSSIFIEEPEANLHPKLQSLLADMFIDAGNQFGIQFIIETHSEYLIRKLQYNVAKKIITPKDVIIYYFNEPDKIPKGKKQIERVNILDDGSLDNDFGPGFFDEATNWKFELMRLKSNQSN